MILEQRVWSLHPSLTVTIVVLWIECQGKQRISSSFHMPMAPRWFTCQLLIQVSDHVPLDFYPAILSKLAARARYEDNYNGPVPTDTNHRAAFIAIDVKYKFTVNISRALPLNQAGSSLENSANHPIRAPLLWSH